MPFPIMSRLIVLKKKMCTVLPVMNRNPRDQAKCGYIAGGRSSQGRTGRRGMPNLNIIHLAIPHNTITTSDIPNEYTHCYNHQTTARKFDRSVGRNLGARQRFLVEMTTENVAFVCTVRCSRC